MFSWFSSAEMRASFTNISTKSLASDVVGADALEHEHPLEALHAVGDRAEHLGHPARADSLEQDVPSEPLTLDRFGERHWLTRAPTVSRSNSRPQ